ncbi:MAG: hypothetical protein JRG81_01115 [Deltaproteobacteria bacterium]|nr:hypothetical protein [Deltaproteobacteria bacterium]MBW2178968.1 hypothetical protein [Deltaproteobacteria bacterium]
MDDLNAEEYIPHRGRMKLIDKIVLVSKDKAVTESIVNDQWPLFDDRYVNPVVLVELAAQTAGIYIAWNKEKKKLRTGKERGWIVGINSASFFADRIRANSIISTHITSTLSVDSYMKLNGHTRIGEDLVGEIGLQLFWIESDEHVNDEI